MRRGSFRRRLPRGRLHRRKINPALLAAAVFLVLLVPTFLYLLPHMPSFGSIIPTPIDDPSSKALDNASYAASSADSSAAISPDLPGDVLKIASSEEKPLKSGLSANVKSSGEGVTQIYLENAGQTPLERVKVQGENGKALGILSSLSPGEKKILAMKGPARNIKINAFDSTGREVIGEVHYEESTAPVPVSGSFGGIPEEIKLGTQAAPQATSPAATPTATPTSTPTATPTSTPTATPAAIPAATPVTAPAATPTTAPTANPAIAPTTNPTTTPAAAPTTAPKAPGAPAVSQISQKPTAGPELSVVIAANRSEGREGDVVAYRCTAKNIGNIELSDVRIFCEGKTEGTKFLTPGKEIHLDGVRVISESFQLSAGAEGKDTGGHILANNTSTEIWEISPQLNVELSGPKSVHRGEKFMLNVLVENAGNAILSNITVADAFGEIGKIPVLKPGETSSFDGEMEIEETLLEEVKAIAQDSSGREVYASCETEIRVLKSSLGIVGQPTVVTVYPGQPAEVTWELSNTGEETLRNITLSGDDGKKCMLKELSPGRSIRMAALYTVDSTSWINVTAQGRDQTGYSAAAQSGILIKTIKPGIGLKVTPGKVEVCPGEEANISCLIANTGDDDLQDITLYQQGSVMATLDRLAPGDFRVVDSRTTIPENTTLKFDVSGIDSMGQVWSDSAEVEANVVVFALKIFASASPQSVAPGSSTKITCTVANSGSIPLYNIFVISKAFGPLGTIDSLLPKRQKTVSKEMTVTDEVEDSISAEGFTQERSSVRSFCQLKVTVLKLPGMKGMIPVQSEVPVDDASDDASNEIRIRSVKVRCGEMDIPLNLPSENGTAVRVSEEIAKRADSSVKESSNRVLDGISQFLSYIQRILERDGLTSEPQVSDSQAAEAQDDEYQAADYQDMESQTEGPEGTEYQDTEFQTDEPNALQDLDVPLDGTGAESVSAAENYELSIESVKGSEHGAIRVMDVSAVPTQPAAWEPVKVSVHVKSSSGVKSASARWGLSDSPLTKTAMMDVNRVYDMPMALESGNGGDGYWSCTLPGKASGTYMALSVWLTDGSAKAEAGPYMLHWSTINSRDPSEGKGARSPASSLENGMLFIESSSVRGKGEVSIKDTFKGSALEFNEKMKGNGSISLESLRCIDKKTVDNFTERKDLVFTGGQLKGHQKVSSPTFHGGMGASVTERFNLSHVDKSETSMVSSASYANNTLAFNTDQAFDGTWNIQTQYAKFYKKIKNVDFIPNLKGYQQTTDYTCGPAALLSLAKFYGLPGVEENAKTEMRIAQELGTRDLNSSLPGTKPQEMTAWLVKNGFYAQLEFEDKGDGTALQRLRDNIHHGIPTLVEWIDLNGHWAIAVGYDYRNVSDPWDDVLILADPYDRYDDYQDGYSFVNANRFYWMWFDALYFGNLTWRTMITATPKETFEEEIS